MLVLSVVYGGKGFPFLSSIVFSYLIDKPYDITSVVASDIPDNTLQLVLRKVCTTCIY